MADRNHENNSRIRAPEYMIALRVNIYNGRRKK